MAKFTSETGKAARQKWAAKYQGTAQHSEWAEAGYWACAAKWGWKITNKVAFGQNYSKGEYKHIRVRSKHND